MLSLWNKCIIVIDRHEVTFFAEIELDPDTAVVPFVIEVTGIGFGAAATAYLTRAARATEEAGRRSDGAPWFFHREERRLAACGGAHCASRCSTSRFHSLEQSPCPRHADANAHTAIAAALAAAIRRVHRPRHMTLSGPSPMPLSVDHPGANRVKAADD